MNVLDDFVRLGNQNLEKVGKYVKFWALSMWQMIFVNLRICFAFIIYTQMII